MYPPGSTFKLVNGLIALHEGVIFPETKIGCNGGHFYAKNRFMKCHNKKGTVSDLNSAIYNNSLIISDNLGYIRKIDMDDLKIVWEKYLSVPFVSNLIINKKKIYVLNINSKIFCF